MANTQDEVTAAAIALGNEPIPGDPVAGGFPATGAIGELIAQLEHGETIEAVVFGHYGYSPDEEEHNEVPRDLRGKVLTLDQAAPHMQSWSFRGGFGGAETYKFYAWSNQRVFWVHEYDGSTWLCSMPRNPVECSPEFSGEGAHIWP